MKDLSENGSTNVLKKVADKAGIEGEVRVAAKSGAGT
jgi:hypothetical protein